MIFQSLFKLIRCHVIDPHCAVLIFACVVKEGFDKDTLYFASMFNGVKDVVESQLLGLKRELLFRHLLKPE